MLYIVSPLFFARWHLFFSFTCIKSNNARRHIWTLTPARPPRFKAIYKMLLCCIWLGKKYHKMSQLMAPKWSNLFSRITASYFQARLEIQSSEYITQKQIAIWSWFEYVYFFTKISLVPLTLHVNWRFEIGSSEIELKLTSELSRNYFSFNLIKHFVISILLPIKTFSFFIDIFQGLFSNCLIKFWSHHKREFFSWIISFHLSWNLIFEQKLICG